MAFRSAKLLPHSFDADVEQQDAQTWALFCFCLWTLNEQRRPFKVANDLAREGVSAWTDVSNEDSNAVQWLSGVFTDWERCMQLDRIEIDAHYQVIEVAYKDGSAQYFRNRSIATPWTLGQERTTQPDQRTVIDSMTTWHLAGFFCGHTNRVYEDDSDPRGNVVPVTVNGHKYKP